MTDPANLAAHLAVALNRHRLALVDARLPVPAALAELEQLLAGIARNAQEPTGSDTGFAGPAGSGDAAPVLLTTREAAALAGVSVATIRRRVQAGVLPCAPRPRRGHLRIPKEAIRP